MRRLLPLLTFLLFSLSTLAVDIIQLERKGYQIEQFKVGYDLDKTISRIYQKSQFKFQTKKQFKRTFFKWNPHLRGMKNLTGQYYYTKYPFSTNIGYNWAPSLRQKEAKAVASVCFDEYAASLGKRVECKTSKSKKRMPASTSTSEIELEGRKNSRLLNFIHITVSQGQFSDSIGSSEISSEQNSPFTIGAGLVYLPGSTPNFSIASSIYYSNLTASDINDPSGVISNSDIDIPAEVGFNLYGQRNLSFKNFNAIYGGVDYEEFNVYNFDKILNGETTSLKNERQKVIYGTLGLGFNFDFKRPVALKLSGSKSLSNSTDLEGYKFMLYFNQKISKRFWYHLLFKQHLLSNDSRDVAISRYGIGVGMGF